MAKKPMNRLPELLVAGFIFAGGAWFWSQQLAPRPDVAPEIAIAGPPDGVKQEFVLQPSWLPAQWKAPSSSERQAAQKVIIAQLNAFKANNWAQAISYQSKNLKRVFPSQALFRQMMVKNYPQFTAYKTVDFGKALSDGKHIQLAVNLIGKDGKRVSAIYSMIKENGSYRVDGVRGGTPPSPSKGMVV